MKLKAVCPYVDYVSPTPRYEEKSKKINPVWPSFELLTKEWHINPQKQMKQDENLD